MKKLVAILLLAALVLSQAVYAEVGIPALQQPMRISGFIVEEDEEYLLVESSQDGSQVRLNLGTFPYVADCVSGQPMLLEDRIDDKIIAYYGPITTRSIPPMSNAVLIICNIPEGFIAPTFGIVESIVERSKDEVKFMVDNGGLIVTITSETPLAPFITREIVTLDSIDVGDELLMWYPMVAMSYPAQAHANKVVRLGRADVSGDIGIVPPIESLDDEPGFSVYETPVGDHYRFSGVLPMFTGHEDVVGPLNIEVSGIFERTVADLEEGESVNFSVTIYNDGIFTSVVMIAFIPGEAAPKEHVYTFVLTTEDFARQTLADLLGPNAYKLASTVIARQIEESEEGAFFIGENAFHDLTSDPSFFVNDDGVVTIIFGKYAVSPGVTGSPMFNIPLAGLINYEVTAQDIFVESGVRFAPLRAVAEALGYAVSWDDATRGIALAKNGHSHLLEVGKNEYDGHALESAPVIRSDRTYVPFAYFELVLGTGYLLEENVITIFGLNQ